MPNYFTLHVFFVVCLFFYLFIYLFTYSHSDCWRIFKADIFHIMTAYSEHHKAASLLYSEVILSLLCTGKGRQGDPAGGGAASAAGQHASAGGEPDVCRPAQEVHRVVLPHHRQEALMETPSKTTGELWRSTETFRTSHMTYTSKARFLLQFNQM